MTYRIIASDTAPIAADGWSVIELAYTGKGPRRFAMVKA